MIKFILEFRSVRSRLVIWIVVQVPVGILRNVSESFNVFVAFFDTNAEIKKIERNFIFRKLNSSIFKEDIGTSPEIKFFSLVCRITLFFLYFRLYFWMTKYSIWNLKENHLATMWFHYWVCTLNSRNKTWFLRFRIQKVIR